MRITRVKASNWKNFKTIDVPLDSRLFIVGPNASGKSNLLDLFRFMGDLAASGGGGVIGNREAWGAVQSSQPLRPKQRWRPTHSRIHSD